MDFDWDEGNRDKNLRHGVHDWEIEEALEDKAGGGGELGEFYGELRRDFLGRSRTSGKYLRIIYTVRKEHGVRWYRPISAREMSPSERRRYRRR